jgi:hypothetical protein
VLIAMLARSSSTGDPMRRDSCLQLAAAVKNAVLSVPPRRFAAALVSSNGARSPSIRRFNERSVHSGDLACSVSLSWLTTPRTVSAAAELASGMPVGSLRRSITWRTMPSGKRKLPANRSWNTSLLELLLGAGGRSSNWAWSIGGGSGASRAKSRNCSDSFTLPSPSVMVWCSFSMRADLRPRRPSTTTNCQSGRVRSNGSQAIRLARSSSWRIVPGLGSAMWRTW